MKATKGNKQYTITAAEKEAFLKEGYVISNDKGEPIAYPDSKTVPYTQYLELESEVKALQKALAESEEMVDTMQKELDQIKKKG